MLGGAVHCDFADWNTPTLHSFCSLTESEIESPSKVHHGSTCGQQLQALERDFHNKADIINDAALVATGHHRCTRCGMLPNKKSNNFIITSGGCRVHL